MISRGQLTRRHELLNRCAAEVWPATITINGQAYDASTGGLKREQDLINGGWLPKPRISFMLPLQAFEDAGQAVPKARDRVTHAQEGTTYAVDLVTKDGAGITVTLACIGVDA